MNIKQLFVLVLSVMLAFWLIDNPPMMAGATRTAEAVVDIHRLREYLAADALLSLLLLVLLMRTSLRTKTADTPLCPRCREMHPIGRPECADSQLPAAQPAPPSPYLLPDPIHPEYRRKGMPQRALLLPVAVVLALTLLGCFLYANNLDAPSERPSDAHQSNLSRR